MNADPQNARSRATDTDAGPGEILIPEVLPPEDPLQEQPAATSRSRRAERAFGPVVAGIILDLIDLATFGPIGLALGMVIGGGVVYYICRLYNLPMKQRLLWALAGGLYCTIPFTEVLPIATLVGAVVRYRESAAENRRAPRRP